MKYFLFTYLIPFFSFGQMANVDDSNLNKKNPDFWIKDLSWDQIINRARNSHKYIFIDCYASWCGPCKRMDKEVYTNDSVKKFIIQNYLPIKVQIDTSKNDSYDVVKWYADAEKLQEKFKISAFPTLLFLSPDGNIVHKELGFKDVTTFLKTASDALDPQKQYYKLINNYQNGIKEYSEMQNLAFTAFRFKDTAIALKIAYDYIDNYLLLQPKDISLNKKNIEFLYAFARNSSNKGFWLLYSNAEKVNKIMDNPDFVQSLVQYVIAKEVIDPVLFPKNNYFNGEPDWNNMGNKIKRKYNSYYSDRVITEAKMRWYGYLKNLNLWVKYGVLYVNKYGTNMNDFQLANYSWFVFENSIDTIELNSALSWTKKVLSRSRDSLNILPNVMDTYANLFYKIEYLSGNKNPTQDAINMEEKAISIWSKFKIERKAVEFKKTLELMKSGQITWGK